MCLCVCVCIHAHYTVCVAIRGLVGVSALYPVGAGNGTQNTRLDNLYPLSPFASPEIVLLTTETILQGGSGLCWGVLWEDGKDVGQCISGNSEQSVEIPEKCRGKFYSKYLMPCSWHVLLQMFCSVTVILMVLIRTVISYCRVSFLLNVCFLHFWRGFQWFLNE